MTSNTQSPSLRGQRVMVIAGDFLIGLSITEFLRRTGAETTGPFSTAEEVIDALTHNALPHLVVMQARAGELTSSEMLKALRANHIPVAYVNDPAMWENELLMALHQPS